MFESTLEKDISYPSLCFPTHTYILPHLQHTLSIRMDGINVLFMAEFTAFMFYLNEAMSL